MAKYDYGQKTFINPYNFVPIFPLEDKKNESSELHTGYLHCKLTSVTPIAIPDTEEVNEDSNCKGHMVYKANRLQDQVMIPGSSIRGMIRSIYEAATNSCMVTINPDEHITRRSDLGSFSPCIVKLELDKSGNKRWNLYAADRIALIGDGNGYKPLVGAYSRFEVKEKQGEKYIVEDKEKLYFGTEVEVEKKNLGHEKFFKKTGKKREVWGGVSVGKIKRGSNTGCYLYLGEAISSKHAESVFEIKDFKPLNFTEEQLELALKGLEDTLAMYRSDSINRNLGSGKAKEKHFGYQGYDRAKKNGAIPLWYSYKNGKLYLSLAAIGRIAYQSTMGDIALGHSPCTDRSKLCPACSIFGMVGKGNNKKGIVSKVRVSDAVGIGDIKTTSDVTLKELGSPRVSYLKFYSTEGKDYDEKDAQIRGRKFYWHIPAVNDDSCLYSTNEKTNRNASFELINKDNEFEFDVYYDELTEQQLDMLIWSIALPEKCEGSKELMHKLGHGKPLGLGSVKIEILSRNERSIADGYSISRKKTELPVEAKPELLHKDSWEQLKKLLEYDPHYKEDIRYPYVELSEDDKSRVTKERLTLKDNVLAGHQWFSNNKSLLPLDKAKLSIFVASGLNPKKDVENAYNGNNGDSKHGTNDSSTERKRNRYEMDKSYFGVIIGHNTSGAFAKVELNSGDKASFRDKNNLPKGTKVELKYNGKDNEGYNQWILVKRL